LPASVTELIEGQGVRRERPGPGDSSGLQPLTLPVP